MVYKWIDSVPVNHPFDGSYRLVPSTFDAQDISLQGIPRPLEESWKTGENILKTAGSKLAVVAIPTFWQMESLIHSACRNTLVAPFYTSPTNTPLAVRAIIECSADTVISTLAAAQHIARECVAQNQKLPLIWILIRSLAEWNESLSNELLSGNIHVANEIHLVPGTPLLFECLTLARSQGPRRVHRSPHFIWKTDSEQTIQPSASDPLQFSPLPLPFVLSPAGRCECGIESYTYAK